MTDEEKDRNRLPTKAEWDQMPYSVQRVFALHLRGLKLAIRDKELERAFHAIWDEVDEERRRAICPTCGRPR